MALELVSFDIETTGFGVDDEVTTVGFAVPMGVRVFIQTGDLDADNVEMRVDDRVPVHAQVTTHTTERALFEAVGSFTTDRLQNDDVLLVAFNGERWKGGFDLRSFGRAWHGWISRGRSVIPRTRISYRS